MPHTDYRLKGRIADLGLYQVDIIRRINAETTDETMLINPSQFSKYLTGADQGPKARTVLAHADKIVAQLESDKNQKGGSSKQSPWTSIWT